MLLVRRNARLLCTSQVARAFASDATQRFADPGARERHAESVSSLLRPPADSRFVSPRSQELAAHLDSFEEEELDGDETFLATARAASDEAAANPALQARRPPGGCFLAAWTTACALTLHLCSAAENRACGRHRGAQLGEEHVDKHAGWAAGAAPGGACVQRAHNSLSHPLRARCRRCLRRRTRREWRRWGSHLWGHPARAARHARRVGWASRHCACSMRCTS